MNVSKIATSAVLALSLVGGSTVAQAAPAASKLSVNAPARAGATTTENSDLRGRGGAGIIIAILAAAAIIAGIIIAADNNNSPTSR